MGSTAHGRRGGPGRPWPVPNSQNKEDVRHVAMTRTTTTTPPLVRSWIEGSPEGARAANLLVGVMVALLLIALAVVVMLA